MKTQMKFQKILSLVTLILAALTFVYALSFVTEIYALIPLRAEVTEEQYAAIGKDPVAVYNLGLSNTNVLFAVGLIFLLISITLYITASQKRRNYYVTNYVSVIATAAMAVVVAILGIVMITQVAVSYSENVDQQYYYEITHTYELLNPRLNKDWLIEEGFSGAAEIDPSEYAELEKAGKEYADCYKKIASNYGNPTFTFVIGYVLYVAVLAAGALNALSLLWKIKLMQGEKALLGNEKPEEKAEEVA